MKKRNILFIVCVLLLSFTTQAFAASSLVKEYTFTTTDKDFKYSKNKTIKEDGKKYEADKIEYKLLKTEEGTVKKEYANLTEKKVPEEITEGSTKYKLKNAEYTESKITGTEVYHNHVRQPNIPNTKEITEGDVTVTGTLKDVSQQISQTYNVPFSIPAKFYGGADVNYYVLNGKKLDPSLAPTFSGYKADVLAYLNLDGNIYRVDSGAWASDYYTDGSGEVVRNATFTGMQRSNSYTATYEGDVYKATAEYVNPNGKTTYTVKAFVTYKEASNFTPVLIGAGIVVIAGALSLALFLARKKRKNTENKEA